jgi:hypothetical protein
MMPTKKKQESQADQSARFVATVRELEAAGALNPTAADKKFVRAFRKVVPTKKASGDRKAR